MTEEGAGGRGRKVVACPLLFLSPTFPTFPRPPLDGAALRRSDIDLWKQVNRDRDWREILQRTRDEDAAEMSALRHATRTGRPLGGEGFVQRLEATFGRKLDGKRTGRPKKEQTAAAGK